MSEQLVDGADLTSGWSEDRKPRIGQAAWCQVRRRDRSLGLCRKVAQSTLDEFAHRQCVRLGAIFRETEVDGVVYYFARVVSLTA